VVCPICSGALKVRDSKRRKLRCTTEEIADKTYLLRRMRCETCGKLHTELPDSMKPYKQYETDAIQAEIDGSKESPSADESTLRRWKAEFHGSKDQLEGALRALWQRHSGTHYPLLPQDSLLKRLRENIPCWLRFVNKVLINGEFDIHTQFAFAY